MRVLITGGTGFIGRHLIARLLADDHEVICLTRNTKKAQKLFSSRVMAISELPKANALTFDAVINLAGVPIADARWSESRKALLRESRINLTYDLVGWISQQDKKPHTLISGSAIGFYGSQDNVTLFENSDVNDGFTHQLCVDWENAALSAEPLGVRVCLIRTGIVLGDGGALSKMLLPFKLGLGGKIASGEQVMSWVHIDDEVEAIVMMLTHEQFKGPYNLTAPNAVTNAEFTQTLGKVLKRPTCLPMPSLMPRMMLGEGAELLLEGQRVYPAKLIEAGFEFKFAYLNEALADVI